jgi:hypothetical protein
VKCALYLVPSMEPFLADRERAEGTVLSQRESVWSRVCGGRRPSMRAGRATIRDCRRFPHVKFTFLNPSLVVGIGPNLSSTL